MATGRPCTDAADALSAARFSPLSGSDSEDSQPPVPHGGMPASSSAASTAEPLLAAASPADQADDLVRAIQLIQLRLPEVLSPETRALDACGVAEMITRAGEDGGLAASDAASGSPFPIAQLFADGARGDESHADARDGGEAASGAHGGGSDECDECEEQARVPHAHATRLPSPLPPKAHRR